MQQGTVNSPILFNIFNSNILNLFELYKNPYKKAIAFADDLTIYTIGKKPSIINKDLQETYNKIQGYCNSWKLKINSNKCETILFRLRLSEANEDTKRHWKRFVVKDIDRNHQHVNIEHKTSVKYLGINIDHFLKYTNHIKIQLHKAKSAFFMLKRLFYNRYLHDRLKIVAYMALIRPIITYGCPIWFNVSASTMEKIRVFERKCLRACLSQYRSAETNYFYYISNKKIYNKAKVPRIDNFILKIIRNHFASTRSVMTNGLIQRLTYPSPLYVVKTLTSGHIPPEAFLYLDEKGFIQNN